MDLQTIGFLAALKRMDHKHADICEEASQAADAQCVGGFSQAIAHEDVVNLLCYTPWHTLHEMHTTA